MTIERVEDEGGDPACWAHLFEPADEADDLTTDALLTKLVRDLADAVIICDAAGTIRLWNAAATRIFGWTEPEAIGAPLDLIIPVGLRTRHWDGYHRVMETGTSSYADRLLEVPALRKDGGPLSIVFTVSLLTRPDGSVLGIAAVIRDDTARWEERRQLRRELTELRADQTG